MNKVEGRVDPAEIEKVLSEIIARFHPQKVILFGSYAYGQPHEWSDLDLLTVTSDPPPRKERWKITDKLEQGEGHWRWSISSFTSRDRDE